jgi:prepilin-type N-terminal cleavage/methylation domain-containing protein
VNRREDNGFTLVELLISVAVLGIIAACIGGALVTGMMSEPEVRHTSTYGAQSAFLISQLSDDVANATSVSSIDATPHAPKWTCTPTTLLLGRVVQANEYIDYQATIQVASQPTSNGGSVHEVDITRAEVTNVTKSDTVLTAWCNDGSELGYGAWFANPTYSLELELQPSPGSIERELSLSAAVRTAPAGTFTVAGTVTAAGVGLNAWPIAVYSPSDVLQPGLGTTTNGSGAYSLTLPAGVYKVCQSAQSGYAQATPTVASSGTTCSSGNAGFTVNPASTTGADFTNTAVPTSTTSTSTTTTTLPGNRPACPVSAVVPALDPATGFWPGNKGIDYGVRADLGESVQAAVDKAAQPDSATTGDINGDGVIIIMVYGTPTGWGGSANQSVVISANYNKKFALFGCSVTLKGNAGGPAVWVKSTAGALSTWMPSERVNANIYVNNLHGGTSQTGVRIDGNGRYLDTEEARTNTAGGIAINGDSNVVHGGDATGNTGVGLAIVGSNNVIDSSFNAMSSTSHGITVQGNSNQLLGIDVGEKATPNGGDGIHMTGNLNTIDSDDLYSNSLNGLWLSGDSNTINKNAAGVHTKGNGQDGYHVAGNANVFTQNTADENTGDGFDVSGGTTSANTFSKNEAGSSNANTGAAFRLLNMVSNLGANKSAGVVVPKTTAPTKCNSAGTLFPSASATYGSVQACT